MKRILFALLVITLCCTSCAGQQKKETSVETKKERGFQLPEVPVMLDTPEACATFVCEHFWDHFDFADTLASGKKGQMYGLKADYTLLFFYNPDCQTCMEIKNAMKQSSRLKELVSSEKMKVLTLYPDEDVALWRSHLNELSDEWVNGYDKGQILTNELHYDLSAIPSFYLLDKDKKVLLKDADWREVMQFLEK